MAAPRDVFGPGRAVPVAQLEARRRIRVPARGSGRSGGLGCRLHCPYMKMVDLKSVKRSLTEGVFEITVDEEDMAGARRSLERMMAVPRDA